MAKILTVKLYPLNSGSLTFGYNYGDSIQGHSGTYTTVNSYGGYASDISSSDNVNTAISSSGHAGTTAACGTGLSSICLRSNQCDLGGSGDITIWHRDGGSDAWTKFYHGQWQPISSGAGNTTNTLTMEFIKMICCLL